MKEHSTCNSQCSTSIAAAVGENAGVECRALNVECFRYFLLLAVLMVGLSPSVNAQETEVQYLSGHGKDDAVPWNFFCTSGANSGFWTNLPVPSQWDIHGFGTLNYHKDLTNAWDERGLYEHDFTVPADWSGKRIFLVFDGVMTDTGAKLNGQSVGPAHQGGFYRFKYEVTPLVKCGGTNRLEVTVARHSANESVNRAERLADYWVFAGIYRPVYLEAVPPEFIDRVAINARADGTFSAEVLLDGATDANEVEAQIQTLNGQNVGSPFSGTVSDEKALLTTSVTSPKLWTAETPNLYRAEFRLKQNGKVIHEFTQRFGLRTFEVRDGDGLYLNGQRVVLKGANRHSFWPDSGRCLSEAVHRLDIETMKDMNMNAVRMSHYPPDAQFLDLCDEFGLYVLDELAGWHNHYDDTIGPNLVREMIVRDVNHPSVIFWDNGNEGGFNTNLDHIFPELDPQQRRVLHPWSEFGGVNTAHYLLYDQATQAAAGIPLYYHANGRTFADPNDTAKYIYMPTEFLHGLYDGGAGAGLDDYWRMMSAEKYLGGGFIWALVDEGVKRPDNGKIDVVGNAAPDGIVGPYREREGSFYAIKEIWSPIQVTRETNGIFRVKNHFGFTDASQCKFSWQVREFPQPGETNSGFKIVRSGVLKSPSVPPGGEGALDLGMIPKGTGDAFALRVDDPTGRELWTWVWPETAREIVRPPPSKDVSAKPPVVKETSEAVEIKTHSSIVTISKQTGMLSSVSGSSFANGPRPAVGPAQLKRIAVKTTEASAIVTATFEGALRNVVWTVRSDGWMVCDYTYTATGTNDSFGVLFDYPENLVKHKRWLGDGPFRVWQNRLRGVTLNVWENGYNDTLTGYRDWIYPEFKGFFANWRWLQLDTKEGPITVVNNSGVPFVQVLTPGFAPTNLMAKAFAPVPQCGLGFLDAIPPIGSKFKEARFSGPQGQPAVGHGDYSGSVSFYFGPLP
jgi:hypothetical protein